MAEFTGERVIPGQVDPDLWNEHFARYAFAARLARGKRVLDVACGTGYGAAELALVARSVTGVDISPHAIAYARQHYTTPNLTFHEAHAGTLSFHDASFDLITAFELIEHLENYHGLLQQGRRLLTPAGQFIVSTPNRLYYEETRRISGPNPFHVHEFEFEEFRALLGEYFPHVSFYLQNHTDTILLQPHDVPGPPEVRAESLKANPTEAHFFIAVCALAPQLGTPTFVFIPAASNALREREHHIALLEQEVQQKSIWLDKALADHKQLVADHHAQTLQLQQRNQWAEQLNQELQKSGQRVVDLQNELAAEQKAAGETVASYEEKVTELHLDSQAKARWAIDTETRLSAEISARNQELAKCIEALHSTESHLEKRTKWAFELQAKVEALQAQLSSVQASRWYKVGRTLGLGPELRQS